MKTLVVAPHADDEVLGCAGTLLRRSSEGGELGWLLCTSLSLGTSVNQDRVDERDQEIARVARALGDIRIFRLDFLPAGLDSVPMRTLVERFSAVFREFEPAEVLLPFPGDAHTDHRVAFEAAAACCKWFRYPSVTRVLAYETVSETEAGLRPGQSFCPNVYIDISSYLDRKIEIMSMYKSEIGLHPFPRSVDAVRGLATWRGAAAGYRAAEAFQLIRQRD